MAKKLKNGVRPKSKLPWKAVTGEKGRTIHHYVVQPRGRGRNSRFEVVAKTPHGEDAQYIAHAANFHGELVGALDNLLANVRAIRMFGLPKSIPPLAATRFKESQFEAYRVLMKLAKTMLERNEKKR